jgi:hypothetical protein
MNFFPNQAADINALNVDTALPLIFVPSPAGRGWGGIPWECNNHYFVCVRRLFVLIALLDFFSAV